MKNITEQIREACLDMMKKVKYTDKGHVYTLIEKDECLQGVSSVSSIVPKDWLSAWGAKETARNLGFSHYQKDTPEWKEDREYASQMWELIKNCKTVEEYQEILKTAKGASKRKSAQALIDGTSGHDYLSRYVMAQIRKQPIPELPKEIERPVTQFKEWEKQYIDHWVVSEALVANVERKYAGRLDAIAILKDKKAAIVDFKFSSEISEDYYLQTAGYLACFESYGIEIPHRVIIRLPKTEKKDKYNVKTKQYEVIDNKLEARFVPTPYEVDREIFYHCLPLKQWINKIKNYK